MSKTHRWAALAALGLLAGCATQSEQTRRATDQNDPGSSVSVTFVSQDKAALDRGSQAILQGDYDGAAKTFESVYRNPSAKPDYRAHALYLLGTVQANALNPKRDPATALITFQKVVDEYPKSTWRRDAEDAMRTLRPAGKN